MNKVITSIGILSVSALALFSAAPAYAADATATDSSNDSAMDARVARMEHELAVLSQNDNRPAQQDANWFNKIRVSGGANLDAKMGSIGAVDNATPHQNVGRFSGENSEMFSLNDAFVNVDADVNEWVSARVGMTYSTASENYNLGYSIANNGKRQFDIDQAYVTIANFQKWAYYVRAGRQYLPFGQYDLHPITKTMTQVLSEVDATAVNVGFLGVQNWNFVGYVFQNPIGKATSTGRDPVNYGLTVGYSQPSDDVGFYVKGGYLRNLTAADVFSRDYSAGYTNQVGAYAVNAGMNFGMFDVKADYVRAASKFSNNSAMLYKTGKGALPSALDLQFGTNFEFDKRVNRLAVGFGTSSQASFLGLPQRRYSVSYTIDIMKNVNVGAQIDRDTDYSKSYTSAGGTGSATGSSYNVVTVRLGVTF